MKLLLSAALFLFVGNSYARDFTDPQIMKVLTVTNEGEVKMGKLAKDKTKNPEVKKFAEHMIKDHERNKEETMKLADKMKATPEDNELSKTVKKDGDLSMNMVQKLEGKDFDKAYINDQVLGHQQVLENLDKKLIPNVENSDLKAHLEKTRKAVKMHLDHGMELQKTMM
jgi:putative membrane protein